ncbi:alpha/beta fold hydrolase [Anaerosphaera multitolerans]|uniref:Alpha/beta hydrolase n=1 Tax=Anaerosphaera multitolerans TaxID=2487351 RepID=A0A437S691_9FIRM|nr:alpha/beta hydrolase [Anaerosphaera multitolerans]RVU54530.1 alpha/beta hydrolase [Anaerosphaera multitolerans]
MAVFENKGVKLFYEVEGEGSPIIFTHGATWNHLQWENQVNALKDKFKVITWDVRGHGYSTLPEGPIDPEDFTDDLIALMDHLNLDKAVLCGLSMGGHISLHTAIKYPERVDGLVLIGTPCSNSFNLYEMIYFPLYSFYSKIISMNFISAFQACMLSAINPSNFKYIIEANSMLSNDRWNRIWTAAGKMESKRELNKVQCPTLLLIGEYDFFTNYQQEYMADNILNAKLKVISNATHATNMDNPNEVNQAILEFI